MERRAFIRTASAALTGLFVHPAPWLRSVMAATPEEQDENRFFVYLFANGGLDGTLGLDPQILDRDVPADEMFLEYRSDEILNAGKIRLGPAAHGLRSFASRLAVINGILMSDTDNGHGALSTYMQTGDGSGSAPTLPVELAVAGSDCPFGVLTNTAMHLANRRVLVSGIDTLKNIGALSEYANIFAKSPGIGDLPVDLARGSVVRSRGITEAYQHALGKLEARFASRMDREGFDGRAAMISAAAFLSGVSRCVYARLSSPGGEAAIDIHVDHVGRHLRNQADLWNQVASTLEFFGKVPYGSRGESLLDRVTLLVATEFSRTPYLNASRGKDHNPLTNSALLVGRGVRPGVYGSSRLIRRANSPLGEAIQLACPIDYTTGHPATLAPNGRMGSNVAFIMPESIVRTVAEIMAVDFSRFRSIPETTRAVPGLKAL